MNPDEVKLQRFNTLNLSVTPPKIIPESAPKGYRLHGVDSIEIPLDESHWYGLGAVRNQRLPLEKISIPRGKLLTADPITPGMGESGFLGAVEPFWFNSAGFGIYVESDKLIEFSFNAPVEHPTERMTRPFSAKDVQTDGKLKIYGDDLSLRIFHCINAREVVEEFYKSINHPAPPPLELFERPLWSTWAHFKNEINEANVGNFANEIVENNFACSVFGIDAKWQAEFGDTSFDSSKFPDPQALIEKIHDLGFGVSLWNIPFIAETSEHYPDAISAGLVLTDKDDGTPYAGRWWEGKAAFLNLSDPRALEWHIDNLIRLAESVKVDGFKFDAGESGFYMDKSLEGSITMLPQHLSRSYVKKIAESFPWSDTRTACRTQDESVLLRHWDKASNWSFQNGLASCITQSITLNLLGYKYNFPDMIGGNEGKKVTEELMIRWTQAVAPMPVIQFSIPPWKFGKTCSNICLKYARLHCEFASKSLEIAASGLPIVRPLWWVAPGDENALCCEDQYMIGNDLIAAPVIQESAVSRDIYLPAGSWKNYWDKKEVFEGPIQLKDFPAPIDVLPLFERV
jgi:alpha-glucosidase (family GH31 glycosyl hydrolase)